MAKKKKTKSSEAQTGLGVDLTGLILLVIGFIGFGLGPAGAYLKIFAMFLVGTWWVFPLLFMIGAGLYMLLKRKMPHFGSKRLIGLYLAFAVLLIGTHFGLLENSRSVQELLKVSLHHFMERTSTINGNTALSTSGNISIEIGGGMVGALLTGTLYTLFRTTGTKIISIILAGFSLILGFDLNLANLWTEWKNKRQARPRTKTVSPEVTYEPENNHSSKDDNKIVITSLEELKTRNEEIDSETNYLVPTPNQNYILPPLSLLDNPAKNSKTTTSEYIRQNKITLESVLHDFQINGRIVATHIGPAVTQYEVVVPKGTKVNRILGLHKEIALAMAAKDVRIQAPIPGKKTIGIEIPNPQISMVRVKEVLETELKTKDGQIMVALGKDIMGNPKTMDITKTPHLLIAGATGSGKSVCINTILASILMKYRPDEIKLVLVDPKKVELSNYNGVPHLLTPVVTDPKQASIALQRIVGEMENRYNKFEEIKAKNITTYNELILKQNRKNPDNMQPIMPYIIVIIDELADLMLVASKEVEDSIMRITQMARAAGIHLIVATQRPSTDVITGIVKSNIPSRISFAVSSNVDSRTILDMSGAEKLLGKGDMLYLPMGENIPTRIQGCFISDEEIRKIIAYCVHVQKVKYDEDIFNLDTKTNFARLKEHDTYEDDEKYDEIVEFAIQTGKISTSLIQRRFRLGYNRAARIMDLLAERGIIGPPTGTSKPREVLVKLKDKE